MLSTAAPVLVRVAPRALLLWPIVVPLKVRLAGEIDAVGPAVTAGLPMKAARSAISSEVNLLLNNVPMPPLLAAKAWTITVGLFAAFNMPLTLLAGLGPWQAAQLLPPEVGPLR